MEITRGAIVLVAAPGDTGRQRPFVIVQSDIFNDTHSSVTACPLTDMVGGEALFRVAFSPLEHTGLTVESEVKVDKLLSIRRDRIVGLLGRASPTRMEQVDQALRRWLGL